MTGSITNNSTSQQQIMLMLQQLASQNSLANDLNSQDTTGVTSTTPQAASPLTGGSTVSSDVLALLVQSQSVTSAPDSGSGGQVGPQNPLGEIFQQLAQSIQSGDLTGSQNAFASLSQLFDSQNQVSQSDSTGNPFVDALNQIGNNLQSNNLPGAQQSLAALQQLPPTNSQNYTASTPPSSGSSSSSSSSTPAAPTVATVINPDGTITTITTAVNGFITTTTTGTPSSQNSSSSSSNSTTSLTV